MHISEGVLSLPVLAIGAAIATAGVVYGLRKLPAEKLMTAALFGAAFFVASLIHVPIGIANAHLVLNGLLGTFLGFASFPVIFIALLLQAFLLGFGGLTTLGVNTATLGIGALFAGVAFHKFRPHPFCITHRTDVAAFCCGAVGVIVSALLTALALAGTSEGFVSSALALLVAHIPVACIEGVLTLFVCRSLLRLSPHLLER